MSGMSITTATGGRFTFGADTEIFVVYLALVIRPHPCAHGVLTATMIASGAAPLMWPLPPGQGTCPLPVLASDVQHLFRLPCYPFSGLFGSDWHAELELSTGPARARHGAELIPT
jgi:hypothetical protein